MTIKEIIEKRKHPIRAVFFDIDGTLVSFNTHEVPTSAKEAIHAIREKGIKVFIATGRPIPFINNLKGVEYDGIMSVNGACIAMSDGTMINEKQVPKEDIERLIADAKLHPMPILFADKNRAIATNLDANRADVELVMNLLDLPLPQEQPIEEALKMDVMQVIAFFREDQEERIMNDILPGCDSNRWHYTFTDCIAKGTSKATGIDDICSYLGIDIAETMAFGDGGNDLAMLRHAGIGVAMGNANDEVKAAADYVTDSVDDDGIANVLRWL